MSPASASPDQRTIGMRKKIPRSVSDALTGWLAGVGAALLLGLAWPFIFPAIVRPEHYYGADRMLSLLQALVIAIIIATPAALVGGIVGGRISVEGGTRNQRLIAIIFGILFSLPFTLYGFSPVVFCVQTFYGGRVHFRVLE